MPSPGGRAAVLICAVLAIVTIAAYWQVRNFDFVHFDDNAYVCENQHVLDGLTWDGVIWAFTTGHASNWHPVTWLSHMLDCQVFGKDPGPMHLVNVFLHLANTLLLFVVLRRMTSSLWPSAFVAAAFAIHPMHVESVAWIAERKDVLSTLFWLLTMAAYVGYVKRPSVFRYTTALVLFAVGLMAKPMLVTLPFVLLLLDYWPLNRFEATPAISRLRIVRSLAVEKIPFLVLSAASCVLTYVVQKTGGAVATIESLPFGDRLSNAIASYIAYIVKTVWPVDLAVLYPFKHIPLRQSLPAFLVLVGVTVAAVLLVRRRRYFAVGWLWYIGTLVPVIGLVKVGSQSLADRYTYIPLTGLFIVAAWAVGDLCRRRKALRFVSGVVAMLLLAGMFAGTRNQLGYWKDDISLYRRAIQVTENNSVMHMNLGIALIRGGQLDEAIGHCRRALQINPGYAKAHNNLGFALARIGQSDEAINHLRRALQIDPDVAKAHYNLGNTLAKGGQLDEAINHLRRALQIDPDYANVHYNLGNALAKGGQLDEAIGHYRRALQIDPDYTEAHMNLGNALAKGGQLDEAIGHYRRALQIEPNYTEAHMNLGNALAKGGQLDEAIGHFRRALQIDPDYSKAHYDLGNVLAKGGQLDEAIGHFRRALQIDPDDAKVHMNMGIALVKGGQPEEAISHYRRVVKLRPEYSPAINDLAWILATASDPMLRNPAEAVRLAQKACELTVHKNTAFLDTLAVAYASADRFDEAVSTAEKALELAEVAGNENIAQEIRGHLKLFRENRSYIDKPLIKDIIP